MRPQLFTIKLKIHKKECDKMAKSYYNVIETLVSIWAVNDNKLKLLLRRKKEDPYKGYWMLPGSILSNEETLEEQTKDIVVKMTQLPPIYIKGGAIFSNLERDPDERVIGQSFFALTLKDLVALDSLEEGMAWFDPNDLPKMAYDHKNIIESNFKDLKQMVIYNEDNILLKLFPSDFTIPEFQKFFEFILEREVDRRNFSKKVIGDKVVIDTGEKSLGGPGRPGKLYRLNSQLGERSKL